MRSALRNLMSRYSHGLGIPFFCALFVFAVCFISETSRVSARTAPGSGSQPDITARARAVESYGKLPLSFEANTGQTDQRVKFLSRGGGYTLFLTSNEAVLALGKAESRRQKALTRNEASLKPVTADLSRLQNDPGRLEEPHSQKADPASQRQVPTPNSESRTSAVLRMKLLGANPAAEISGLKQLPGTSNYFIGNDPKKWRTAVPNYAKVRYQDVYPGVDLVYYGNQRQLEYDFVVAPGADPRAIKLDFTGAAHNHAKGVHHASSSRINHNGDLMVRLNGREVSFHKPTAYQLVSDSTKATSDRIGRETVKADYVLKSSGQVGIRLAPYDHTRALVIDPILNYSSYIGGSLDDGTGALAVDGLGDAYVTGFTNSSDFPIVNQIPGACQGSCGTGSNYDVFVTKINAAGSALVYSSYIGGSNDDYGLAIAIDSSGNAYLTGYTDSSDFPRVNQIAGACQGSCGTAGNRNAFVTKINAAGSALVYSSYIGGSGAAVADAIAIDSSGDAYVTGQTNSTDFPIVNQIPGACQGSCGTGGYLDVFVAKINAAGSALVYSSYIGGSNDDYGLAIAVDSLDNVYVTGETYSTDFPRVNQIPGACQGSCGTGSNYDVFVTKINSAASALIYSSYIGGSNGDSGLAIAVDRFGNAYLTGLTYSTDFPRVNQIPGACQGSCGTGNTYYAFVTKINATGSALIYSSYIGGSGGGGYGGDGADAIAVDGSGNVYVTGETDSPDFPIVNQIPGACQGSCGTGSNYDVFVTKINAAASALIYSSYIGGSGPESANGIAVDGLGNAYLTGYTDSSDFPIVNQIPGACQGSCGTGSNSDVFVMKISPRAAVGLSPSNLNFGPEGIIQRMTTPQILTLTSTGELALSITSISITGQNPGDFNQWNNCPMSPNTLAPGQQCTIMVVFAPTETGTLSADVTITDNAPDSPQIVPLSGIGVGGRVGLK